MSPAHNSVLRAGVETYKKRRKKRNTSSCVWPSAAPKLHGFPAALGNFAGCIMSRGNVFHANVTGLNEVHHGETATDARAILW